MASALQRSNENKISDRAGNAASQTEKGK